MDPVVATGLFTLGGVIVGAGASTSGQVYLESRREGREGDRAKRLVAGELLHAQLILRAASEGTHWPPVEDINGFLPTSAWQEYRSRLADPGEVEADLYDQLVLTYALLERDRARFLTADKIEGGKPLSASEAASLRKTAYDLGRLRRGLEGRAGGWLDEVTEAFRPQVEALTDSFMQLVDGLRPDFRS